MAGGDRRIQVNEARNAPERLRNMAEEAFRRERPKPREASILVPRVEVFRDGRLVAAVLHVGGADARELWWTALRRFGAEHAVLTQDAYFTRSARAPQNAIAEHLSLHGSLRDHFLAGNEGGLVTEALLVISLGQHTPCAIHRLDYTRVATKLLWGETTTTALDSEGNVCDGEGAEQAGAEVEVRSPWVELLRDAMRGARAKRDELERSIRSQCHLSRAKASLYADAEATEHLRQMGGIVAYLPRSSAERAWFDTNVPGGTDGTGGRSMN
jgi:hypothetical protein